MANVFEDFIPVPSGHFGFVQSQRLMSDLLGQVGYEVRGKGIIYTKDLPAQSPAITKVSMQLIVSDFSKFTDYELLPITADQEAEVIEAVVKMFAPSQPTPQNIDSTSDIK